tara:strand:+ start:3674 stop:6178 length:2505 start_codon:yes stop_codon:yes gene_type:complete
MAIPDKSKYTNRVLGSDIEACGYYDQVHNSTQVWCLVSRDTLTDELFLFHDYPEYDNTSIVDDQGVTQIIPERTGTLIEGVRFWYLAGKNGSKLSIHNTTTYDTPLIEKIWPKCIIPVAAYVDTYILSKMQWFDRPIKKGSGAKTSHSLLNYSAMEGNKKPKIDDFSVMNGDMLWRCIIDTKTQVFCHKYLEDEARKLKGLGIDLTEAYKIEVEYARNCHKQEVRGALADNPHMEKCVKEWDIVTDALAAEIEPLLPPTVKTTGAKITRSELMESLGWDKNKIPPDEMHEVTRAGETNWQAVKPYVKPSLKYFNIEKVNQYSGFNISYGESPTFVKKKDLTDWIKDHHPDTKSKEWDIEKGLKETKVLNNKTCEYFGVMPDSTDLICGAFTRVSFIKSKMTQHEVVKGYLIRYAGLKHVEEWNFKRDSNKQIVRSDCYLTVSYPPKAAPENQLHFKVAAGKPIVTSPKLGENDYQQLTGDIGQKIGKYNTTMHRRRYISNLKDPENKGIISAIRSDGRIPCGVMNYNTSTGRSTHRNIVNLPSEKSLWGKEMRQCLIAPEGKVLVGADQKSSQLQLCAVVTNNTDYFNAVVKGKETIKDEDGKDIYTGSDAHTANAINFNLITREEWQEAIDKQAPDLIHRLSGLRGDAKAPAFSVLFGAGGEKVALLLGIPVQEGNEKRQAFLDQLGLTGVTDWLRVCSKKYKRGKGFYIPIAFGYWIYCNSMHKAANFLIQGLEGIVQKIAVNYFEAKVLENNWQGKVDKILDMHDEFLVETTPEMATEVGELMEESYTYTGGLLNQWYKDNLDKYSGGDELHILPDFAGGYAIGQSYYDCH